MENTFLFKTKNNVSPQNKPRVYFTCHPQDFENTFNRICEDIFTSFDCAVFYTADMVSEIPKENRETDFGRMNLFVIPITRCLLEQPNRAMDSDFPFAIEKHIPILPILMENGVDEIYSKPNKFGTLQYLNPLSKDITEISYEEKLKKYLSSILLDPEMIKRIKEAFDAYIFLSYRKKDRRLANELMRIIHSRSELQDIAVWFDEFLTPGESFKDNINKILHNSKLFALLVTPNLLEEPNGKPNFIMAVEYPEAKRVSDETGAFPILPTEMKSEQGAEPVNRIELIKKFPGLPECVNAHDDVFLPQLLKTLNKLVSRGNDNNPLHNYLIGLAYLNGIDVEVDREKALKLISFAAENGVLDAAKDLVKIYYFGYFCSRDFSKAVFWQKKVIELLQKQYNEEKRNVVAFDLADELRFLTEVERNSTTDNQNIDEMISSCKKALEICDSTFLPDDESKSRFIECKLNTLRSLAILQEMSENFEEALITYGESLKMRKIIIEADKEIDDERTTVVNEWRMAQLYHDTGILYRKKGEFKKAISEFLKSIELYQKLSKSTSDFLPNEASVHEALSYAAAFVDVSLAEEHSKIAERICQKLAKENAALYDLNYANALLNRAFIITELGSTDYDEMENLCKQAENIYEKHISAASYDISFNYINVLYKLAGIYRKKYCLDKAALYYEKATNTAAEYLTLSSTEYRLTLAHLLFDYGTFLTLEPSADGLIMAVKHLKKALSLFYSSGSEGQKFIDETKSVIETIENVINNNESELESYKNVDGRIKKIFMNYQYYLNKGDEAEKSGNYQKACLAYKSSLEQILALEELNKDVGKLPKADVLDRLALCCEMSQNLSDAEMYYVKAAELASEEAMETHEIRAIKASMSYFQKVITFLADYGREKEAAIYRRKLSDFKNHLLAEKETAGVSDQMYEKEQIIELPDREGNRTPYKLLGEVEYKHKHYLLFIKQFLKVVNRDFVLLIQIKKTRHGDNAFSIVTKSSLADKVYDSFKRDNIDKFIFTD